MKSQLVEKTSKGQIRRKKNHRALDICILWR